MKTFKIKMGISEDGCKCGNREYRVRNNIYTLTIHCNNCDDGYCIYDDGGIRKLDNDKNYAVKEITL